MALSWSQTWATSHQDVTWKGVEQAVRRVLVCDQKRIKVMKVPFLKIFQVVGSYRKASLSPLQAIGVDRFGQVARRWNDTAKDDEIT